MSEKMKAIYVIEERNPRLGKYYPLLWTAETSDAGKRAQAQHIANVYPTIRFRLAKYVRKETFMVKHHGKPLPPKRPGPAKPKPPIL